MNAKKFSNILLWITFFGMLITACAPSDESAPPTATDTVEQATQSPVTREPIELLEQPTFTPAPFNRPDAPPTATERPTEGPSATLVASNTPEPSATATLAPSATLVASYTPEPSPATEVLTLVATYTPEPSPTEAATATLVASYTPEPSPATEVLSATLVATYTPEPSPTEGATATLIATYTPLPFPTAVLSATLVATYTPLPSPTEAATATLVPTYTPLPPQTEAISTQPIPTVALTEASSVIILSEESGVEGRVELGPTCGNMPTQGDVDCSNMPYQAYLTITDSNGQVVTQGPSNADGSYRFSLPPGDYLLIPEEPQGPIEANPIPFSVTANNFTYVTVLYDTMIP